MTSEKSVNVILNANCAERLRRVTDLALVHEMFTFLGCYKDLKFKDAQNGKKTKTEANSNVENETSEAKSKNRFRRCKYALAAESLVLRSFLVWKHGPEIRTNAVIYWFMLPLCVYLQCVPAPLPSYTPRQLACVNLPLTEANQFCLGFFFFVRNTEFARESKH